MEARAGCRHVGAEFELSPQAEAAATAGGAPADDDALAGARRVDPGADRLDDTAALVAEQPGKGVAHAPVASVEIRMADAGGEELEPNLTLTRVIDADLLQPRRRPGLAGNHALCLSLAREGAVVLQRNSHTSVSMR